MVQRYISDRCLCKSNEDNLEPIVNLSTDSSNRIRRVSNTEDGLDTGSKNPLQALQEHCNILASEMAYRDDSGVVYYVTKAHAEPQEIRSEDRLTRQLSTSSFDAVEDHDPAATTSKSRPIWGLLGRGGHRGRAMKRKTEDASPSSTPRKKRGSVKKSQSQAVPKSKCNPRQENQEAKLTGAETEVHQIMIRDAPDYYVKILQYHIKQDGCRDIIRVWIRYCHPQKQTRYPYNGGAYGKKSVEKYGHKGALTTPGYWPSDTDGEQGVSIPHTEPDHLKKKERIPLILHLIRLNYKGPENATFTLKNLMKSTKGIHLDTQTKKHWDPKSIELLQQIYRVRAIELQYERGEIDGDTVVSVLMPKAHRRTRGPRKSAVNVAKSPSKHAGRRPKQMSSTTCKAPVAKMCIDPQVEGGDMDLREGTQRGIHADTPSSTGKVTPLSSTNTPESKENWTLPLADLRQDSTTSERPSSDGSAMKLGQRQTSLPPRNQHHSKSSVAQSLPSQVAPSDNDKTATPCQRLPTQKRPNRTLTHRPLARPVAPKVPSSGFSASSSGLSGHPDYSSWERGNHWNPRVGPSPYPELGDPNASFMPPVNYSSSSYYGDAIFSSNPPFDRLPCFLADTQQPFTMQETGIPGYQHSSVMMSSESNQDFPNPNLYPTYARTYNSPSVPEQYYGLYSQGQGQT